MRTKKYQYKVETFPLSLINIPDFENALNEITKEGWGLKQIFTTTVGLKVITVWEK